MISTVVRVVFFAGIALILSAGPAGAQSILASAQGTPVLVPDSQIVPQEISGSQPNAPFPTGDYQFSGVSSGASPSSRFSVASREMLQPAAGAQPSCASCGGAPGTAGVAGGPEVGSLCDDDCCLACDPIEFPVSFGICSGIVGGADMVILRPYAGDLRSLNVSVPAAGVNLAIPFASNEFNISPRIWVGYVGQTGLGVRARYWRFDQALAAENTSLLFLGGGILPPGTLLTSAGGLDMYAIDAEVTQRMDLGLWKANIGGGVRVADVTHDFSATVGLPAPAAPVLFNDFRRFDGVGPTLFAEFRRPLGCTGFSLVANGRGSLLFGEWQSRVSSDGAIPIPGPGITVPAFNVSEKNESVVSVAELQLGVEWARQIRGGGSLFVNALWEGQVWTGSKSSAQLGNADVALMGVSVGAGITR